jgi:hypothetical protein
MCELSPYTGEWMDISDTHIRCNTTDIEFYRRHRSAGRLAEDFLEEYISAIFHQFGGKQTFFAVKVPLFNAIIVPL